LSYFDQGNNRGVQKAAAAVAMFVLAFVGAAEAAPTNDSFNAAQPLVGASGSVEGTNVDATKEMFEANHAENPGGHSVWYRWIAPFSGSAVVDTCSAASFDTLIGIYTGPGLLNAARVASSNNDCGIRSQVTFPAESGTVYHIAVDGANGAVGTFTLSWGRVLPPANDAFAASRRLSGAIGAVTGTTLGATRESGEPSHGSEDPTASAWYVWTAGFTGGVTFETCSLESFDTALAAYTGDTLSRLRRVAANDNNCGLRSRLRFAARRGRTYRIAVDTVGPASGEFTLSWSGAARPRNDKFASARRIRGVTGAVTASNRGATAEARERPHARNAASSSMWYRWRAPRTMRIVFDTCGSGFDTVLALYRGSSLRRARVVRQNNNACARTRSRVVARVAAGVEYRVVIDGYRGATGSFRLSWRRG
jgi:microcompartment protein CcmK/EutM